MKRMSQSFPSACAKTVTAKWRSDATYPFPDGNGRVSKLMSHAMVLNAGIGGQGLWSVSRGLARGLNDRGEYKRMMDLAGSPRRGDRDGRGNLFETALKSYSFAENVIWSLLSFGMAHLSAETRNTLSKLTAAGYLASALPLDDRERLFPHLFSDAELPG